MNRMKALTDSQIMFLHESICKFGVQLIQVGRQVPIYQPLLFKHFLQKKRQ